MKIFKFRKVDDKTGVSVEIEKPREGPANPKLPGLDVTFVSRGWTYANVSDEAEAAPDNYIYEITQEEFDADVKDATDNLLAEKKEQAYSQELEFRKAQFGKYHETATIAGIYKYEQAKAYIADNTVEAAEVAAEATARGLTTLEMANKIVTNHESFRAKEAKLAGLRGKITDRLDGYVFDDADALGSWRELAERTEVIGTRESDAEPGLGAEENLDVTVGYYDIAISQRWEYLG